MYLGKPCPGDAKGFPNGTTNGAHWYLLEGKLVNLDVISSLLNFVFNWLLTLL